MHASAKTGELAGLSGVCILTGEGGRHVKQLLTAEAGLVFNLTNSFHL